MDKLFELISSNKPAGDQPKAIEQLVAGLKKGYHDQTLMGVTGSGKSVVASTPILIRDASCPRTAPIGEIIDSEFEYRPEDIAISGDTEILDMTKSEFFAWSFDPISGQSGWKKITQFTRHKVVDVLYRVTTGCGRSVTVTGDHNFYALHGGDFQLCKTTDLVHGGFLPVPRMIEGPVGDLEDIDLGQFLSESKRKYFVEVPVSLRNERSLVFASSREKRWRVIVDNERLALSEYENMRGNASPAFSGALISGKRKQLVTSLSQSLTDNFLRFVGYYVAEGHAERNYLKLSSADLEIIKEITEEAPRRGMSIRHRPGTYDYQLNSMLWADIFSQWCGSHSTTKMLPPFWSALSNRQLAQLLSAYFSADGGVDGVTVSAATISERLASDICHALLRFGIVARMKKRMVKVPNTERRSACWRIFVSGKANLDAFAQNIGFTLERKIEALEKIIPATANTNVDIIPVNGKELKEIRNFLGMSQRDVAEAVGIDRSYVSMIESESRFPSAGVFQNVVNHYLAHARERGRVDVIKKLETLAWLPRLFWTPIENVQEAPKEEYVYDIAVADNETFLAGNGGLFVHNTFTMANVIAAVQQPTLVIAHNKTLAAQLTNEFRELFPHNAVNYFVSYYDYYQPEAYMPSSDTYIDKEALINDEIDKLRHAATMSLLTRRDVIVVASVSCIYGLGAPAAYAANIFHFKVGDTIERKAFARKLIELQFTRTNADLKRGTYRLRGDHWEVMPPDPRSDLRFRNAR